MAKKMRNSTHPPLETAFNSRANQRGGGPAAGAGTPPVSEGGKPG